ncbi:MAG: DUF3341 domain-containing protein [Bacteroidota bacterium]|nr:DUF3341 domain-containing protein [Bacteroidota bacterium]
MQQPKFVVGLFSDPHHFEHVCAEATERGWRGLEAYLPYPLHGIERALRLRRSWVTAATKTALLTGATLGMTYAIWTSAVDYPLNIGGRPFNSWPAFVPVLFESGVIIGAFTNFFSLLYACRLFPGRRARVIDPSLTDNRFALLVPLAQKGVRQEEIEAFFREHGAEDIRYE